VSKISSNPSDKSVFITGCSSGIGRATALFLARRGFLVFATVRKESDAEKLRALREANLVPVCPLELTDMEAIARAARFVQKELHTRRIKGLYALINNAGGGGIAPLELMDLEKFHIELKTRILAPVALLQAFLPLIREARGRIVWIATPALLPIPYVANIHACDFAVNYLARALNLELTQWQIPNILVRCGVISTASVERSWHDLEDSFSTWKPERLALYRETLEKEKEYLSALDKKRTNPEKVAEVVFRSLTVKNPHTRYQVGSMSKIAALAECFPQTFVDHMMAGRA